MCRALFGLLLAASGLAPAGEAQCSTQWAPGGGIPGASGNVYATIDWDPDGAGPLTPLVVIGGEFTHVGNIAAQNLATWNPATGVWSALGGGCDGAVTDFLVLPSGELLVAGAFASSGGVPTNCIAKWNGVVWSSVGGGVNAPVSSLALAPSGDVFAGGSFVAAGGAPARFIARWDGSTWSPVGSPIGNVNGLQAVPSDLTVLPNGHVVSVGYGYSVGVVELWDGAAWTVIGNTSPGAFQTGGVVSAVVWAQGQLFVGGSFTHMGGTPAANCATWNGTTWSAANLGNVYVTTLSVRPNGAVLAGGYGSYASSAWSFAGGQWTSLGLSTGMFLVWSLLDMPNGELLAAGDFVQVNGVPARKLARWDGTAWRPFAAALDGTVHAIAVLPNQERVLGGEFTVAGGMPANHIVRWDGSSFRPLGVGMNDQVRALVVRGNGDLVAAGFFTSAGGVGANGIARYDGTAWFPLGSGIAPNGGALAVLERANGDLIVGGFFNSVGGVPASGLARWDGAQWSALGGGTSGFGVYALASTPNGDLYAGGSFWAAGGVPAVGVARWNGVAWSSLGTGIGSSGTVYALAVMPNGDLIVGGSFHIAGAVAANNIARWDGTQWSALGQGLAGVVEDLVVLPTGELLAAGGFTSAGGTPANHVARWDGTTWFPVGQGAGGDVVALGWAADGTVSVGGPFLTAGGAPSAYFAEFRSTCAAEAVSFGAPCLGPAGPLVLSAPRLPWIGSTFGATASGFAGNSLGASLLGFTSASTPLGVYLPIAVPGCVLLASPDALQLLVPQGGAASTSFAIPYAAGLAGLPLFQQVLQLGVNPQGQPSSLSGSNGLALRVGSF